MCIYKIYKTREDIEYDYNKGKLQIGYIFAYDRRLYIVTDSKFTFYEPYQPVVFMNRLEQDKITKMCNLLWYDTDIIIRLTEDEEDIKCYSHV